MSIHQILREARESQGISLEEVAQKTYIKLTYLSALEEGNHQVLPPPIYSCGYVRQYARLLGLDAEKMVRLYQESIQVEEETPHPSENGEKKERELQIVGKKIPLPEPIKPSLSEPSDNEKKRVIEREMDLLLGVLKEAKETVQDSQQKANTLLQDAEKEATHLKKEADKYILKVFEELEGELKKLSTTLQNGRSYLQSIRRERGKSY